MACGSEGGAIFVGNSAWGCNVEPTKAVGEVEPLNEDQPNAEYE